LPDHQHFLFRVSQQGGAYQNGIYVGALNSQDVKLIATSDSAAVFAAPGFLLYSRRGVLMAQPFNPRDLTTTGEAVSVTDGVEDSFIGFNSTLSDP
jgi:hypothetical protein